MILLLSCSSSLEVVSSTTVVPQMAMRGVRSWEMMSCERVFKVLEMIHPKNREPRKARRTVPKYQDNERGNSQGSSSFNMQKKMLIRVIATTRYIIAGEVLFISGV